MKIALCIEYPIDQTGGTEVLVSELIKGLGRQHQILLVSPDDAESLAKSPVADFVTEHICWQPAEISVSRSIHLAEQLKRLKRMLIHCLGSSLSLLRTTTGREQHNNGDDVPHDCFFWRNGCRNCCQ